MIKRIILWLFAFYAFCIQAQTTSFITYGMENGMVQNQVQSITQDNDGNLWVGTISGLSRYNGTDWFSYTKNSNLAEDWITCSIKDKDGNIWFGHWAGGITRFNVKTQQLENLNLEEYTRFKSIKAIQQDYTGKFWIATEGAGIFIFDAEKNKMFALSVKDGLASNTVYDLCMDKNQNMWMATDSGLTVFNLNSSVSTPASFQRITTSSGLFSKNITSVLYTSTNLLVLGSADKGIAIIPAGTSVSNWPNYISSHQVIFSEENGLKSTFIKTLFEDAQKNIWAGTIGGGASVFIPEKNNYSEHGIKNGFFKTYSTRQGLNYFNVNAIYQDREGSIWVGTDLGLNQYRGDFMQTFDEADELPNNIVWSVFNDSQDNIWLGTNNGLAKLTFTYERDGKTENHTMTQYTEKQGLASNVVLSVFEDSKGNLWFGTAFNGVSMLPKGSSSFKNYGIKEGLPSEMVYSIAEDKAGNIWFGTKAGASKFDPKTSGFRNYTEADGLGGHHIYRIYKDSKGLLWIGALGGNLSVYDGVSFKKYNEDEGLKQKFILCINEDHSGNIWFGCYGGGLFKFDGKTFTNYGVKQGLKTETPYSIIIDNNNNIWVGDNRGIDKLNTKTNTFYHYGKSEGFSGVECNPNASCIDKNGNLWFGTIMGAVRFNPAEELENKVPPLTRIYGLKIHLKDALFPAENIFSYKQNNITFTFIGVSLTNPEKLHYEYTLEGFDHGWIPAQKSIQEATYTNLPAGNYTFKVRSYNNNNVCSETASYTFKVTPPFWQTALFYVLLVVTVLFAVFVFDKIRTRNLKLRNAELEHKVTERTQQLAIKNEELAEKNKDITDSIRYAKYIQDAMLPKHDVLKNALTDYFLLFKPKDIVSGDFYWTKQYDNSVYIAAVDCTGHGVPGAFISIQANNILNAAFNADDKKTPANILARLDKLAKESFHAKIDNIELRDGMDLSICKIDYSNYIAEFSGAYNSLYLIRDNKLIEYNADNISIGNNEENKPYTNHVFKVEKGDIIYLMSDGFADQFGGDKGKKFKYAQLQQLLVKNNTKTMEVQKQLLDEEFEHWKGSLEQVDDVLIIGIKIV